jgi:hypothetical protein
VTRIGAVSRAYWWLLLLLARQVCHPKAVVWMSWRQALHHALVYQRAGCTQHSSGHSEPWCGLLSVRGMRRGVGVAGVVSIQETPSGLT